MWKLKTVRVFADTLSGDTYLTSSSRVEEGEGAQKNRRDQQQAQREEPPVASLLARTVFATRSTVTVVE